jgi:hypothetical protein
MKSLQDREHSTVEVPAQVGQKVISVVPSVRQGAAKEAYSAVIAPGKLEGIAERSWRKHALDSDCIAIRKSRPVLGR